jgi:hypothetical protein
VFGPDASTEKVFDEVVRPLLPGIQEVQTCMLCYIHSLLTAHCVVSFPFQIIFVIPVHNFCLFPFQIIFWRFPITIMLWMMNATAGQTHYRICIRFHGFGKGNPFFIALLASSDP